MSDKPRIYVTRKLPQPALDLLERNAQVTMWPGELPPPRPVLLKEVAEIDGLLALLTDRVDEGLLRAAPRLRVVSNFAVGYDNIDVPAATSHNVLVCNTPGVLAETTADFAVTLLLAAARRVVDGALYVKEGRWRTWGPETLLGRDIYGSTVGLIGLGEIGLAVARRLRGFGVRLLYNTPSRKPDAERELGMTYAPVDELLRESDIVTLHCPLNDETYHLIDRDALESMKPEAILVNTARGPVIDTRALVEVLKRKPIIAALDVTDPEPLPADHGLLTLPNALVVPHMASASVATRTRMALMAAENLLAGLRGERPHAMVNPQVWQHVIEADR